MSKPNIKIKILNSEKKSKKVEMNINKNSEKNYKSLTNFLNAHRITKEDVNKGKEITHTTMDPRGKYNISGKEDKVEFYKLYKKDIKANKKITLVEQHSQYSPILIDLDFRFELDNGNGICTRKFNDEHVVKVIEIYRNEIEKYFKINNNDKLKAYVFQRENPYIPIDHKTAKPKNYMKDGVHIIFRDIITSPDIQYIIRENVIKEAKQCNLFKDLKLTNSLSDVFDKAVINSAGWMMYGSVKPGCKSYKLTKIYDENFEESKTNISKSLYNFFSIRKTEKKKTPFSKEGEEIIDGYNKKINIKQIKKQKKQTKSGIYNIEEIRALVNLLTVERATNEFTWKQVGWCLYCIDSENDELLDIWVEFSKQYEHFKDETECETEWHNMKNKNLNMTIGSLKYWAKLDNPVEYAVLKSFELRQFVEKSINCTNYDVARVLYEICKDNFVCVAIKKNIWYEFKNHKWGEIDSGVTLRRKISNQMVNEYIKVIAEYNIKSEIQDGDDDDIADEKEKYAKMATKFVNLTYQLKTTAFKDNIMKESKELFYDKDFFNKLDTNLDIVGFENGVYDLNLGEFREGRPDDYLSLSTKINFIPIDELDKKIVDEVNEFMSQVFVDEEIREYMWRCLSSYLQGHNPDEKFHIWTGNAGAGKSKLKELFVNTFGEYCINFPITLLTGKRAKSNAATPEIAQSRGKRFGYFDEPDQGEKINVGIMKGMTGGDIISARGLYVDKIEFKPQFKLILLCNDKPEVPAHEDGTWRRICVVEFLSTFVDKPEKKNKYQFKRDGKMSIKMEKWQGTFMTLLLEKFKEYQTMGLAPPSKINEFTNEYQKASNTFIEFLEEHVELENKENKEDEEVAIKDLYADLKDYCEESGTRMPYKFNSSAFGKYVENTYKKHGVKIKKKHFIGLKYKKNKDNEKIIDSDNNSQCDFEN